MSGSRAGTPLRISVEEAKKRYDKGQVTVLDVVDADTHEQLSQQITDAIRVDPRDISDALDRVPESRTVLTY